MNHNDNLTDEQKRLGITESSPHWKETRCVSRTCQAVKDIGSVKKGDVVTRYETTGVCRDHTGREITPAEFESVRTAFYEYVTLGT